MPVLGQHKIYDFRKQTLQDVRDVLLGLIEIKDEIVSKDIVGINKIFQYAEAINASASKENTDDTLEMIIDKEVIRFLDAGIIAQFIADPNDDENREAMSIQLAMVATATHSLKLDIPPYTKDELRAIFKGEGSFYNDLNFVSTLRHILSEGTDGEIGELLLHSLPSIENSEDVAMTFLWDEAVIFSMILQTVWSLLPVLNGESQKFLIQNYFYFSTVIGVPVRIWIQDFLNNAEDFGKATTALVRSLDENNESVPLNDEDETGKSLVNIFKEYVSKVYGEQIAALEQEKFIEGIYPEQKDSNVYSPWLRETLNIVQHLRKGDILDQ